MTIATFSDATSMFRRMGHTNNAVKRQSRHTLPYVSQAFFPIFGVLLCALAMMSAFLFVQSTLIGP